MTQTVRFCCSADGTLTGYGAHGSGPPLMRVATWLTHLEYDWESPLWRHWLTTLADGRTLVRYDHRGRGCLADLRSCADAGEGPASLTSRETTI